jgi:putative nucleotidyltransferase with HDIG domain
VALVPDDAGSPDEAMLTADHRMYQRKALGRESAGRQTADVLIRAVAEHNSDLGDHTRGVAELSSQVARRLGLDDTERSPVRRAALLHDVGKIAIPDAILDKPSGLDPDELDFIHRHTIIGERILRAAPALEAVAPIVRSSHERWDGSGYPDGLAGERIPLGSRIVFACDAFEAMTSTERPYRGAMTVGAAIRELIDCAGTQFDPRVVEALVAVVREDGPDDVQSARVGGGTAVATKVISGG